MIKKLTLVLSLLFSVNALAMHQQQTQHQHDPQVQQQTPPKKKKQRWHSNDDKNNDGVIAAQPEEADDVIADLKADLVAIVNTMNQAHGSVDNCIKNTKPKHKRIILCPICSREDCPSSQVIYE